MAWVDLESDIAEEFSELAETTESVAANHLLASGQLSMLYGGRKWHHGKPTRTLEEKRAANRAWWRRWYRKVKADRESARYRALLERNRKAVAAYHTRQAEATRQLALLPDAAPKGGDVVLAHCAAPDCGVAFVRERAHQRYCAGACRERCKSRRKRARAKVALESGVRLLTADQAYELATVEWISRGVTKQ